MKVLIFLLSIGLLPAISVAETAAPVSEQRLLSSCRALSADPRQEAAILCNYYIQGYIAGTLLNDAENAKELAGAGPQFLERAYRTRVGMKKGAAEAAPFLHFCIPEGSSQNDIINRLSKHLSPAIKTITELKERLYRALQSEYPCDRPG